MEPILVAILRGVVEFNDGGYYLGSTANLDYYISKMLKLGLVEGEGRISPTAYGRKMYDHVNLKDAPQGRWYLNKECYRVPGTFSD